MIGKPTRSQLGALKWLINRRGDGGFGRNSVLLAGGDFAPVMRATWNRLETHGLIEFYQKRRRVRVTDKGRAIDLSEVCESEGSGKYGGPK